MLHSDKIVWITSYPKSGNTWIRAFLSSYLFSQNGEFEFSLLDNIEKFPKYKLFPECIVEPEGLIAKKLTNISYLSTQKDFKGIYKTHNIYNKNFTNKDLTAGFIYISRNIKDIIISLANHYRCSIDDAIDIGIKNQKKHYDSWKEFTDVPSLYITYEDLVNDCKKEYTKLLHFLHIKIDEKKLENSIYNTSFNKLKSMEEKNGFHEAADYKTKDERVFFKNGKIKQWENVFTSKQQNKINNLLIGD
jgi:hypothetical protein